MFSQKAVEACPAIVACLGSSARQVSVVVAAAVAIASVASGPCPLHPAFAELAALSESSSYRMQ